MQTTSAALFASLALVVFGICYYYFTTRHKERMALIEKGLSPDLFKESTSYLPFLLTAGIVTTAVALGMIAGVMTGRLLAIEKTIAIYVCVFLFLGIGLLLSYFILKRMQNKQ